MAESYIVRKGGGGAVQEESFYIKKDNTRPFLFFGEYVGDGNPFQPPYFQITNDYFYLFHLSGKFTASQHYKNGTFIRGIGVNTYAFTTSTNKPRTQSVDTNNDILYTFFQNNTMEKRWVNNNVLINSQAFGSSNFELLAVPPASNFIYLKKTISVSSNWNAITSFFKSNLVEGGQMFSQQNTLIETIFLINDTHLGFSFLNTSNYSNRTVGIINSVNASTSQFAVQHNRTDAVSTVKGGEDYLIYGVRTGTTTANLVALTTASEKVNRNIAFPRGNLGVIIKGISNNIIYFSQPVYDGTGLTFHFAYNLTNTGYVYSNITVAPDFEEVDKGYFFTRTFSSPRLAGFGKIDFNTVTINNKTFYEL
jgi:hypothetical protein